MQTVDGRVVVVTGAGSGIGRALALDLAGRGARLALLDRDADGLAETASRVRGSLARVVDVSDEAAVQGAAAAVLAELGAVDVLVNNAGIAHSGKTFWELPAEDFRRVLDVNLWGVVHGTRAFLPHLITRPEAALVNISSVFGIMGIGRQSAYCTSKFAVRGFTESLRMELRAEAPHVRTVSVHPGGVRTAIARNRLLGGDVVVGVDEEAQAFEKVARTTPEAAAATIVKGLLAGRERVLVGPDAHLMDVVARALPRSYTGLALRLLQRSETLDKAMV